MENFVDTTLAFQELRGAGQCAGAAIYLAWLYDLFGYEAMAVDYYIDLGVSHVITLVKIQQDEQETWIYQDATFNRTYVDSSGAPLDCFTITQLLKEGRDEELVESFGDTQYRYTVYDMAPAIQMPENSAEILPNTMDYYPAKNNQFLRYEERYGCLIDMRQPVAMEKNVQSMLDEALNPLGYPGKLNYLYLFPYAYYVPNTEEAGHVFGQLQQIAGYEPPAA